MKGRLCYLGRRSRVEKRVWPIKKNWEAYALPLSYTREAANFTRGCPAPANRAFGTGAAGMGDGCCQRVAKSLQIQSPAYLSCSLASRAFLSLAYFSDILRH